jgi:hypothetical protein
MSFMPEANIYDSLPLSIIKAPVMKWIQDFIAPFFTIIKPIYKLNYISIDDEYFSNEIVLETTLEVHILRTKKVVKTSQITLRDGKIDQWIVNESGKERLFICLN